MATPRQRVRFAAPAGAVLLAVAFAAACAGRGGASSPAATGAAPSRTNSATPAPTPRRLTAAQEVVARALSSAFRTDSSRRSIDLTELLNGGPGKDGIPALGDPKFINVRDAAGWLHKDEPVEVVVVNGEARAYPLQVLIWHEMVNDEIAGVPILVTFCPLCNTALAFDRRVDGTVRTFGVSGLLRNSDLVMYDHANESLWQQATGEAIVGTDTGTRLKSIPAAIVAFGDFARTYPDGKVLSKDTGYSRPYGENPYQGYDTIDSSPLFPVSGATDRRLLPKERVLTVEIAGDAAAFPFSDLAKAGVIETTVGGQDVVAFWKAGTASPLDNSIVAAGRDVGAAAAFSPALDGRRLDFERADDGTIVDRQTHSVWDVLGRAESGPLTGKQLTPIVSANHFWFAWSVFKPQTRIVRGS